MSRPPPPRLSHSILAAADLAEDRLLLRRLAGQLGWRIAFDDGIEIPVTRRAQGFDALVVMPATVRRATAILDAEPGGPAPAGNLVPVLFVVPVGLGRDDLDHAKSCFDHVESKPLFLSTFRLAITHIAAPRGLTPR
jgi:hypothetical protein